MTQNVLLADYLRIGLSIASLVFGLTQWLMRLRIQHLISIEAVELHKNIGIALGAAQEANRDVVATRNPAYNIGRTEGINNAVLLESAKLYCNLKMTTIDDINRLIESKQLEEQYRLIYYGYSRRKVGAIRRFTNWISNLIW